MKTEGNKIILTFTHTGSELLIKDKSAKLDGFEIAGSDKKFHAANAVISGDKVVVSFEGVSQPVAVRYNWANDASAGNLFNKELFPAAPFRTDNWDGITIKIKYMDGK